MDMPSVLERHLRPSQSLGLLWQETRVQYNELYRPVKTVRMTRNSVVISPAVLAVRDRGLDPISSPQIITVNGFVVSSSHRNPNMVPDPNRPPSPEWAGALRPTAPNPESPLFRPGVPITPPGLRMPVDAPGPDARPFSVACPALESLTNYLRPENNAAGPAWVNPPNPRPHNLATPPLPLAPSGFDPSPRADAWAQRTSLASSGSGQSDSSAESLTPSSLGSNSDIIMYHRLNDDQIHLLLEDPDSVNPYGGSRFELPSPEHHYVFLATNFINYCNEFPTSNPVIQCARVRFFKRLSCLQGCTASKAGSEGCIRVNIGCGHPTQTRASGTE
ncbi:hypothetical protein PSTG_04221 [Puccinia striiformis f. sp. tritici PST-78]|uniref:Uncharacterized protein n=1 Tax=Puccinia striiformis f. sp. tritici PST-78 TaxID=1165861 RepID=A0A0L0VTN1_9BASI|nr:hypothetical protein PSTG_04221 [Puccinia striiformis f. sp. tritici PST-78]